MGLFIKNIRRRAFFSTIIVISLFSGPVISAGELLDEKITVDLRVTGNGKTVWRPGQSTSDLMMCRPSTGDWRCSPAEEMGALLADDVNELDRRLKALETQPSGKPEKATSPSSYQRETRALSDAFNARLEAMERDFRAQLNALTGSIAAIDERSTGKNTGPVDEATPRMDQVENNLSTQRDTLSTLTKKIDDISEQLDVIASLSDDVSSLKERVQRSDEAVQNRLNVLESAAANSTGSSLTPQPTPTVSIDEQLLETLDRLEDRLVSVEKDQDDIGDALDRILSTPMPPLPAGAPDQMSTSEDDTAPSQPDTNAGDQDRTMPLPDVSQEGPQAPLTSQAAQKLFDALRSVIGRSPPIN